MTTTSKGREIAPAQGKLGVLLPGMGAVATTFIAGVHALRTGLSKPIGSLTQMGTVRLGKLLFTQYLLPFEIVSLILLVGMVGVVLLSKKDLK